VGTVEAVGPQAAARFKPGERVWYSGTMTRDGCNSEYHLIDSRIVGHAPSSLDDAAAAALPLTALTAWESLFDRLGLDRSENRRDAGKTALMVGGGGGVNSIAIQLAKKLVGLKVIATAGRPETEDWVRKLGADAVINHRSEDLVGELHRAGFPHGVDLVLINTTFEARYAAVAAKLLAPEGKLLFITPPEGPLDWQEIFLKSLTIIAELMFARPLFNTPTMAEQGEALEEVARLVDRGLLQHTGAQVRVGCASSEGCTLRMKRSRGVTQCGGQHPSLCAPPHYPPSVNR
jgi:NADPH2:quinone reductase